MLALALLAASARAQVGSEPESDPAAAPASEPVIDLAPEEEQPPAPVRPGDATYLRGMQEERFRNAQNTALGGYGELHSSVDAPEVGSTATTLDLHRLVLFVAHNFDETFRFYTELEVEHAVVAGDGRPSGDLDIEQAFVDWRVLGDLLALRGGVVLVPMGAINQWHEPPIFHGVERPLVDQIILPTTWREPGLGIVGRPIDGVRYEAYVMGGIDASGFDSAHGLRGGLQNAVNALTGAPAVTARIEVEPMLGLIAGVSGYFDLAGRAKLDFDVPVLGVSADARLRWQGLEARALFAYFSIGDVDRLRALTNASGDPRNVDIGSSMLGTYAEIGYDVLHPLSLGHALVPFARFEWLDTTLGERDPRFDRPSIASAVFGLTYRPIPQLAIKADAIVRRPSTGTGENLFNLGVGWMF